MSAHVNSAEVLRFEIAVNVAAYRSLVAGLRKQVPPTHSPHSNRRAVKAAVEFDLTSRSYSVRALGRHRLPQALSVKPGSRTHNNISSLLASSLREQQADDLALLLENIIDATPIIPGEHLEMFRNDIEFQPFNLAGSTERITRTVAILGTLAPTLLLDLDETPTLVVRERPEDLFQEALATLRAEAHLVSPLQAKVQGDNIVEIATTITLPALKDTTVDLYLHWGGYEETAPAWQDELVASSEGSAAGTFPIMHTVYVPHQGHYGATLFLRPQGSTESVWLGRIGADDAHFSISRDDCEITSERDAMLKEMREIASSMLAMSVQNPRTLEEQAQSISSYAPHLGIGALLKEAVESSPAEEVMQTLSAMAEEPTASENLRTLVRTYGVGEVVFTTPEGSHAAAGGLAQVISGLPPALCQAGIPVTIITPLYTYDNGNKHPSAQHLLNQGIQIGPERVQPRYVGSITVPIGPTYYQGTTHHKRPPSTLPIKVFLAQSGKLRVFLLANASIFDRLYQPVYADEQLRRAVAFSRATLETIATSHFGIRPSAIISNDWMTACVPAFAALDPHYQNVPWLKSAKTVHMIHNGGADYHGRLPINVNHEDLWPLLNLSPEHFFGFRDPHNCNLINFTMAASHHASGGILTVSQPYAHQISSLGGGDGIDYVLQHKRSSVYGISNGINRKEIDRYLASITGLHSGELDSIEKLLEAKAVTRARLQEAFGLRPDTNARLVSFVGRMAEQKGLMLLSGFVDGTPHSTLEDLLIQHHDIQILVAGPSTDGDKTSTDLRHALEYLTRRYPGRIAAHFDYVPHSKALEIIFGSSLFLMPSRFEPGGITQLEALATGTLVIGRNVGGISATVDNFNPERETGNGFLCNDYTATAFANTAHWAIQTTRNPEVYKKLVHNARCAHHTWVDRVPAYLAMLQRMMLGDENFEATPWNSEHKDMIRSIAATA
jgi:starch synthase